MGAFSFFPFDFLVGVLHLDALCLEVVDPLPKKLPLTGKLQHHDALFAGQDGSVQDVEGQVEAFGEIAYDRLLGH